MDRRMRPAPSPTRHLSRAHRRGGSTRCGILKRTTRGRSSTCSATSCGPARPAPTWATCKSRCSDRGRRREAEDVRTVKIVGAVALAMILAVAGGWAWGRSGRAGMEERLAACDLRLRFTDAKSRILGGRVDLYSLNFGAAAQNFDA